MHSGKIFKKTIYEYYEEEGRHSLPWRHTKDPYRILVSEIMLQQTQVARVEKYYRVFLKQFPNFRRLSAARAEDVLRVWQGLGYNRRAFALRTLARVVTEKYRGRLPHDVEALESLPGIGSYTARAIRAFAFDEPDVVLETNIRRVFIHFFFPHRKHVTDAELERCIKRTLDKENPREWYWALMDYGAMLGRSAATVGVVKNPNRRSAHYRKQSRFAGSDRELRGKTLRLLLSRRDVAPSSLSFLLKESKTKVDKVVSALAREGFIEKKGKYLRLTR